MVRSDTLPSIHTSSARTSVYIFRERNYFQSCKVIAISIPGENVTLRVGKRIPTKMLGDVYLLIGTRLHAEDKPYQGLMIDIWLRAFQRRIG